MNEKGVILEQRPERWRRYPFVFILFFWTIIIPITAWMEAFIKSKSEKLTITKDRIIYQKGILRKDELELPKEQVRQVVVNQGFLQRIFNTGSISVTTGGDLSEIHLRGFYDPNKIKKLCRE